MEILLDLNEAAKRLGVGPKFPRRLVAERRIRFVKVGRFVRIPESAIEEFVAAGTVEPIVRVARGRVP
ncbi:helix-turn-helix domain-containing protein [Dermatophilaceae bacterium Soc4.6]